MKFTGNFNTHNLTRNDLWNLKIFIENHMFSHSSQKMEEHLTYWSLILLVDYCAHLFPCTSLLDKRKNNF